MVKELELKAMEAEAKEELEEDEIILVDVPTAANFFNVCDSSCA